MSYYARRATNQRNRAKRGIPVTGRELEAFIANPRSARFRVISVTESTQTLSIRREIYASCEISTRPSATRRCLGRRSFI
jgi:hypothetical protein